MNFSARASIGGYLVLAGPFFVLSLPGLWWALAGEKGMIEGFYLCFVPGVLWCIWLNGFRIQIDADKFRYRDGFYRWAEVSLGDIRSIKNAWVSHRFLGRDLPAPRMVIRHGPRKTKPIEVNLKPFSLQDIRTMRDLLEKREGV